MSLPSLRNNVTQIISIDPTALQVLKETLYPGAKDESIIMVLNYCKARGLDPLKKPVHLVPMNVKSGKKDKEGKDIYEYRDVVMPGIGLYRTEADRSKQYAGMSEPEFGEDVTEVIGTLKVTYPKWCKIKVKKFIGDKIVSFTAKEFWKENYATKSRKDNTPNDMWAKRSYGQLAKCAEAQALRKAFPDVVGSDYTKEEMEGKHHPEIEVNPVSKIKVSNKKEVNEEDLEVQFTEFKEGIENCDNELSLREIFSHLKKVDFNNRHDLFKQLVDLKDQKKSELMAKTAKVADEYFGEEQIDQETGEIKNA